jgi:predicted transposase/invertase (TIGR01784 family)
MIKRIPYRGKEVLEPKKDLVFKALFLECGDLELLASLLSCILDLNIDKHDIVIKSTEFSPAHEEGKLSRVDLRVKLLDGKHINVEIQLKNQYNIEKRSIYYASKLYFDQLTSGMKYNEICPAITINILDFKYLYFDEYHNKYRLKNTRSNHELTDVFEINFIELPKVPRKSNNSLKELWLRFLAVEEEEELEMVVKENPILEKAANKLVYVSADEQLKYALDMREAAELDYGDRMATIREEGLEQGLKQGKQEMIIAMKREGLDNETIAKIAKLPIEEIQELLKIV